jgi:NAD(P)-dependent dehydrogenase (short-subunit alcohol dehydrogenase family)
MKKTALVTGATGVIGRNLVKHLLTLPDWDVVCVSRRKPDLSGNYQHIAIDLLDRTDCDAKLAALTDITHIFAAALCGTPDLGGVGRAQFGVAGRRRFRGDVSALVGRVPAREDHSLNRLLNLANNVGLVACPITKSPIYADPQSLPAPADSNMHDDDFVAFLSVGSKRELRVSIGDGFREIILDAGRNAPLLIELMDETQRCVHLGKRCE